MDELTELDDIAYLVELAEEMEEEERLTWMFFYHLWRGHPEARTEN